MEIWLCVPVELLGSGGGVTPKNLGRKLDIKDVPSPPMGVVKTGPAPSKGVVEAGVTGPFILCFFFLFLWEHFIYIILVIHISYLKQY
jgi:hypothetical protein